MMLDRVSYRSLQRLVFLFLVLHNLEEGLTAKAYFPKIQPLLSRLLPTSLFASLPTPRPFYVALAGATLFPLVAIAIATTGKPTWIKPYLVAVLQAILLLNVFIPHVPAAIVLGGYAPGVATAVLVNLPFSVYFFRRSLSESHITPKGLMITMAIALPALLLSIPLLYAFGAWLTSS